LGSVPIVLIYYGDFFMIIDCIGCLHGKLPKLEGGDLLIVTGDLTSADRPFQFIEFLLWLDKQEYTKKIFIGGNHDNILIKSPPESDTLPKNTEYLLDSGTEFEGLKIWGSPWTLSFKEINPKCMAFTNSIDDLLMDAWEKIPGDTDILVTHSPPFSILDGIPIEDGSLFHVGCKSLYNTIKYSVRPRLHVFSHIHEAYGQTEYFPTYNDKMMISVNCSIMNEHYKPVNAPIRIIL
jgi:Icc-related predicted phosphoesterase